MKETFQYLSARHLPTTRDAMEYEFLFSHVNSNLVGKPEEKSSAQNVTIVASITGTLHAMWSARDSELDIQKVLYEFAKRHLAENFVYRMNALKNLATGFNEQLLREKVSNSVAGSINLVEAYLKSFPEYDGTAIKVLRSINRLRQAYPIHTDTADGVQEAHKFFQLPYPIKDYDRAWQRILLSYSDALKRIFDVLNKNSLE